MPPSNMIHAISPADRRAARSAKTHSVLVQASTIADALNVKGLTQACHYVAMRTAWFNVRRPNCCAVRSRSLIVAGVRRDRKPSGMSPPANLAAGLPFLGNRSCRLERRGRSCLRFSHSDKLGPNPQGDRNAHPSPPSPRLTVAKYAGAAQVMRADTSRPASSRRHCGEPRS
jgi:hypothetical protein